MEVGGLPEECPVVRTMSNPAFARTRFARRSSRTFGPCLSIDDEAFSLRRERMERWIPGRVGGQGPKGRGACALRLHEEFRRRVKTQGSLPSEDAAVVLLFSLVASGQIKLRRIDGWRKIAAVLSQHTAVAA